MKHDAFPFISVYFIIAFFSCHYAFFQMPFFLSSFFMPFCAPDGTDIKLTTTVFPKATVHAAEKFSVLTQLGFTARKSLGRVARDKQS